MLETSLGAISRLKDFEAETEKEGKEGENINPPENWPSKGLIQIQNVTAAYKFVYDSVCCLVLTTYSASSTTFVKSA